MPQHVCPWWLAYTFDNPLRRLFHKPEQIFTPYLRPGMTVADLGCGMGYFSIGMANLVGDNGKVIAVDLQPKMLDLLLKRAAKAGVAHRIKPLLCEEDNIKVDDKIDFGLAFWMVHETPDQQKFLKQVHAALGPCAKLLIAEPKLHVTRKEFETTLDFAEQTGFKKIEEPSIHFSHTALLIR